MMISTDTKQAAQFLKEGKIVAVPTETVYGLAADVNNLCAIEKLYTLKGRPKNHPISILIRDATQLEKFAIDIPDAAYALAKQFWPGPLTMILKRNSDVSLIITGGKKTVGLRSPKHPLTQEVLNTLEGLAAPSANRFGEKSPTQASDVVKNLGQDVDLILDGGKCDLGLESTIIDLTQKPFKVLRLGALSIEKIETCLNEKVIEPD